MNIVLVILEVSSKQQYIFGSKKLSENALRSDRINYVTSDSFFKEAASEFYSEKDNMVYAGGGHTILQFKDREQAKKFINAVTNRALHSFSSIELFATIEDYNNDETPGQNLKRLASSLEAKKALRKNSFRQLSFGIEHLADDNNQPENIYENKYKVNIQPNKNIEPPAGWVYPSEFSKLKITKGSTSEREKNNFIAVIHIDGNSMGKRVDSIYESCNDPSKWDECCKKLKQFSAGIQNDFESAFNETVEEVINQMDMQVFGPEYEGCLPIRPVILAGDDVCFVSAGSIGLECARVFLEKLSVKRNAADGGIYSACAGVAIVHEKYPFHRAYELSESLCSNAKKTGVSYDESGSISMIDWHIEFGQLKDGLDRIREDYNTEDGEGRLELRPYVVKGVSDKIYTVRRYEFFKAMLEAIAGESGKTARGKIKDMRTAFKQGIIESQFIMNNKQINYLSDHIIESKYLKNYVKVMFESQDVEHERKAFGDCGEDKKRCLYFDAIEMIDNFISFRSENGKEEE